MSLSASTFGCFCGPLTLAARFPVADWQFWIVTVLAIGALWFVLRSVLPAKLGGKRGGVRKRTTLTISGKLPESHKPESHGH